MTADDAGVPAVHASIRNVGGIDETTVEFEGGVTALTGQNATNRTSFLRAIMAACGSDRAALKGDADEGEVTLRIGDERYTRTLERTDDGGVVFGGEPYLDDPEVADLFGFLLGSNTLRQAVRRGDDLRDLVMRPVDVDEINREIDRRKRERQAVERRLQELDSLRDDLTELRRRRDDLTDELETVRAELDDLPAPELGDVDPDGPSELEERIEELNRTRSELEDVRFDAETIRETLDALRAERDEIRTERSEIDDDVADVAALEREITSLRERKREVESTLDELGSVIGFNEEQLTGETGSLVETSSDGGSVTDSLVAEDRTTCWTCGSEVPREQIEATLSQLRDRRASKMAERDDVEERIASLRDRIDEVETITSRRETLERKLERTETELERRKSQLADLEDRRETLETKIAALESDIAEIESGHHEELLDRQRTRNELEFRRDRLESERADVLEEIERIEAELDEESDLKAEREAIGDELVELRERVDSVERETVEAFNTHMETLLDVLGYANIERIWIERVERTVREGRERVERTAFDLHIARQNEDGVVYEDTIDHLSESEREVTGLVFALAGYLVHEVHETVPFILLDSLEAIDADRIAAVVEYFDAFADYLVVALLPGDTRALDGDHERVVEPFASD
jgi:predicted  nucleic acid-binding Zn-ribbon protein